MVLPRGTVDHRTCPLPLLLLLLLYLPPLLGLRLRWTLLLLLRGLRSWQGCVPRCWFLPRGRRRLAGPQGCILRCQMGRFVKGVYTS
jgi:hypothetical protein